MVIEKVEQERGSLRMTLSAEEVRYLRLTLQRATFQDTPPEHQQGIYHFADALLQALDRMAPAPGTTPST